MGWSNETLVCAKRYLIHSTRQNVASGTLRERRMIHPNIANRGPFGRVRIDDFFFLIFLTSGTRRP